MDTPIADFLAQYRGSGTARFHMPGHKGRPFLGCEPLDITEVAGADSLYEAAGVIAQSEENARRLFGTGRTLYSTEGSSQCVRAMLYLALLARPAGRAPVVLAARNVHRSFVTAAALLDFETVWLWPEEGKGSLCGCPVSPESLAAELERLPEPPAAVYLTSPDYLGGMADLGAMAEVCHRHGTLLLVDNAHGAYLRFWKEPSHPMDLGADLCCDSAHKTLPVLTGGAYLHIGKNAPAEIRDQARTAMALFGSTSPSYLTMASLDLCNRYLDGDYPARLAETADWIGEGRRRLRAAGWRVEETDPLRLTLRAGRDRTGTELQERLRKGGVECEYADPDYLVMMLTPENRREELDRAVELLGGGNWAPPLALPPAKGERVLSIRQAMFSPRETVPAEASLGRICGAPTVACPPAVPVAVSGERIGPEALTLIRHYGIRYVDVLK